MAKGTPVSHVRKDILNGWKEIGGYVGRDIRTVERWEKLTIDVASITKSDEAMAYVRHTAQNMTARGGRA